MGCILRSWLAGADDHHRMLAGSHIAKLLARLTLYNERVLVMVNELAQRVMMSLCLLRLLSCCTHLLHKLII